MKFVYISMILSTLFLGLFSESYAGNTEIYDLMVPQELSREQDNGFISISGIGSNSGVIVSRTHAGSESGSFLCIAPKKNNNIIKSKIVASFPGRNSIWSGNIFNTYYENETNTYPWGLMIPGKINDQEQLGQIFSFKAHPGFGTTTSCSFSKKLIPDSSTKTVTYNIRIQFSEDTKIEFKRKVNGKKIWILKRQDNHQDTAIMLSSFPDYGNNSEWKVTTVINRKLDGTSTNLTDEYKKSRTTDEGFIIPKDTEILSITFTR